VRFYYKFLLLLLVVLGLGLPMLLKGPDGRPIMTASDWLPEPGFLRRSSRQLQSAAASLMPDSNEPSGSGSGVPSSQLSSTEFSNAELSNTELGAGKMYKWQDEDGGWHFSNQKPLIESQLTVEALPEVKNLISAPVVKPASSSKLSPNSAMSKITRAIQ